MADIAFHHGARVFESLETPILIRTTQSAVIAHIGTAPDADEDVFPLNKPILIKGTAEYFKAVALGAAGTLKTSLDGAMDQVATYNYIVRVEEGEDLAETLSNLVGDGAAKTGVHALLKCEGLYGRNVKPRLVVVPGFTAPLGDNGLASANVTAPGASYETAPTAFVYPADATKAVTRTPDGDNTGTGVMTLAATAYGTGIVPGDYRVECITAGPTGTFNVIDPLGAIVGLATVGVAYTGPVRFTIADGTPDFVVGDGFTVAVAITGGEGQGALVTAIVSSGQVNQLVINRPGYGYDNGISIAFAGGGGSGATAAATSGSVANPVVAELVGVLEKLRAIALVDGPDTTDEAAVLWRQKINSDRIYPIDVKHLVWSTVLNAYVTQPASSRFAGVQARVDRTHGFWWSLSNKPINGIGGVSRPISYGDQANYLNENHVNTTINLGGEGFVTWGNRVATGIDLNKFISVRRTMDFINEAIEAAYLEFVDKPFSLANLKFMIESGNAFMKVLRAEGAILDGRVWLDPERNTDEEMAQGRVTLGVDFEPPAPMEDIRFIAYRNIRYYADLRARVLEEIREGALSLAA